MNKYIMPENLNTLEDKTRWFEKGQEKLNSFKDFIRENFSELLPPEEEQLLLLSNDYDGYQFDNFTHHKDSPILTYREEGLQGIAQQLNEHKALITLGVATCILASPLANIGQADTLNGSAVTSTNAFSAGTAGAGSGSSSEMGAGILPVNSAGMGLLDETQFQIGGSINPYETQHSTLWTPDGVNFYKSEQEYQGTSYVPHTNLVYRVSDGINFGIGLNGVSGVKVDYPSQEGVYGSDVAVDYMAARLTLAGSMEMIRNEFVSLCGGVGIDFYGGKLDMNVAGADYNGELVGGVGMNAGLLVKIKPTGTNIGASYISEGKFEPYKFEDKPLQTNLHLNTPPQLFLSITQEIGDNIKIMFGMTQTKWSKVMGENQPESSGYPPFNANWEDTTGYSAGISYDLPNNPYHLDTVYAGYAHQSSPLNPNSSYEDVAMPLSQEDVVALGTRWEVYDGWELDVSGNFYLPSKVEGGNLEQGIINSRNELNLWGINFTVSRDF